MDNALFCKHENMKCHRYALFCKYENMKCHQCTESAVSSDTYIGGKNVEEIAQEIEMGGECGWHLANVCNCGTWKNPQYE